MNITGETVIGELVADNYRTASVFKNYGVDFCCNGNRTIQEACVRKKLDSSPLIEELKRSVLQKDDAETNFNFWDLDLLADYIEKRHHRYVERKIQEIAPFLKKVARVHGDRHHELIEVEQLFSKTAGELTAHMKKEELILFPFIRKLAKAQVANEKVGSPMFGSVQNPIAMMHQDHENEGDRFRRIADITQGYTPPTDACNTYRVTFALLKEFEEDLHLHIHLENNILFPKAIELEKAIL